MTIQILPHPHPSPLPTFFSASSVRCFCLVLFFVFWFILLFKYLCFQLPTGIFDTTQIFFRAIDVESRIRHLWLHLLWLCCCCCCSCNYQWFHVVMYNPPSAQVKIRGHRGSSRMIGPSANWHAPRLLSPGVDRIGPPYHSTDSSFFYFRRRVPPGCLLLAILISHISIIFHPNRIEYGWILACSTLQ